MIEITPNLRKKFRDVFKLARKSKMRVVWLEDDLVYCARRGQGHDRYQITFRVDRSERVFVECKNLRGAKCDGVYFKGFCAHIAAVINRGIPERKKQKQDRPEAA